MATEKMNDNTDNDSQEAGCPRSYKPWVWTLVIMALLTLGWALYEGYQEGGPVHFLLERDSSDLLRKGKDYAGMLQSGSVVAAPVQTLQGSYHQIIENVRPAVISIDAVITQMPMNNAGMPEINYKRIGSGVIISPRGYALSSYHVIERANALRAIVYGREGAHEFPLKVVNAYKNTDLALLRIKGDGPFSYAVLGDSKGVRTGDIVLAMGSPFGFDQTITAGIVSSRHRSITIGGILYEDIIQTDTPINRGNSGGPLVNVRGQIIGINTAIYSPTGTYSGIGFAIPINNAETLVSGVLDFRNAPAQVAEGQLAAWSNQGRQMGNSFKMPNGQIIPDCHPQLQTGVTPANWLGPWKKLDRFQHTAAGGPRVQPSIGVSVIEIDPVIAREFGMLFSEGVLVDMVYAGSPAEKAGLQRGDIIRRVKGRKIRSLDDFTQRIMNTKVGSNVELVLLRNGKRKSATVLIIPSVMQPQQQRAKTRQPGEFEWLGAEITPLNRALQPYVRSGVYVADVEGILAAAGLKRGDIIKGINRHRITDINSFMKKSQKVDLQDGFLLDIVRSGKPVYLKVQG
jgi:S1-C subfamily serine protease